MFYETLRVIYGRVFADTVLAAFGARPAAALLAVPKIRLSKDPAFNPTPDTVIADLTPNEADFSGYTAGGYAPTFSAPVRSGGSVEGLLATVLPIRSATLPGVNNNVYGWWCDDGTNFVAGERFQLNSPVPFGNPGDFLDLAVLLPYSLGQGAA